MMYQKQLDRAMKWLRDKNKSHEDSPEDLNLDSKDIIAIIISALMVFGPIILILIMIGILMYI